MSQLKPALCDTRPGSRAVSAFYVAGRLGYRERSWPWIRRQVEALIAHEGFPTPIILYDCARPAAARRVEGVNSGSRWDKEAVDAWFDGQPSARIPAAIAESASTRLAARYAGELDARAAAMAGAA
ncbi:MAG: hypothetical protein QOH04_2606 [Sphingomonadales bacterium]|jgi:hypothetical protein|nr:hypothetical protein [Sphingomonadales bacterium]